MSDKYARPTKPGQPAGSKPKYQSHVTTVSKGRESLGPGRAGTALPTKPGLSSLGKVPQGRRIPRPHIESKKSEHFGEDPDVQLVPKDGTGWGGKSDPSEFEGQEGYRREAGRAGLLAGGPAGASGNRRTWGDQTGGLPRARTGGHYIQQQEFPSLSSGGDSNGNKSGDDGGFSLKPSNKHSWKQGASAVFEPDVIPPLLDTTTGKDNNPLYPDLKPAYMKQTGLQRQTGPILGQGTRVRGPGREEEWRASTTNKDGKELDKIAELDKDVEGWAGASGELDFNKKIVFSDDEDSGQVETSGDKLHEKKASDPKRRPVPGDREGYRQVDGDDYYRGGLSDKQSRKPQVGPPSILSRTGSSSNSRNFESFDNVRGKDHTRSSNDDRRGYDSKRPAGPALINEQDSRRSYEERGQAAGGAGGLLPGGPNSPGSWGMDPAQAAAFAAALQQFTHTGGRQGFGSFPQFPGSGVAQEFVDSSHRSGGGGGRIGGGRDGFEDQRHRKYDDQQTARSKRDEALYSPQGASYPYGNSSEGPRRSPNDSQLRQRYDSESSTGSLGKDQYRGMQNQPQQFKPPADPVNFMKQAASFFYPMMNMNQNMNQQQLSQQQMWQNYQQFQLMVNRFQMQQQPPQFSPVSTLPGGGGTEPSLSNEQRPPPEGASNGESATTPGTAAFMPTSVLSSGKHVSGNPGLLGRNSGVSQQPQKPPAPEPVAEKLEIHQPLAAPKDEPMKAKRVQRSKKQLTDSSAPDPNDKPAEETIKILERPKNKSDGSNKAISAASLFHDKPPNQQAPTQSPRDGFNKRSQQSNEQNNRPNHRSYEREDENITSHRSSGDGRDTRDVRRHPINDNRYDSGPQRRYDDRKDEAPRGGFYDKPVERSDQRDRDPNTRYGSSYSNGRPPLPPQQPEDQDDDWQDVPYDEFNKSRPQTGTRGFEFRRGGKGQNFSSAPPRSTPVTGSQPLDPHSSAAQSLITPTAQKPNREFTTSSYQKSLEDKERQQYEPTIPSHTSSRQSEQRRSESGSEVIIDLMSQEINFEDLCANSRQKLKDDSTPQGAPRRTTGPQAETPRFGAGRGALSSAAPMTVPGGFQPPSAPRSAPAGVAPRRGRGGSVPSSGLPTSASVDSNMYARHGDSPIIDTQTPTYNEPRDQREQSQPSHVRHEQHFEKPTHEKVTRHASTPYERTTTRGGGATAGRGRDHYTNRERVQQHQKETKIATEHPKVPSINQQWSSGSATPDSGCQQPEKQQTSSIVDWSAQPAASKLFADTASTNTINVPEETRTAEPSTEERRLPEKDPDSQATTTTTTESSNDQNAVTTTSAKPQFTSKRAARAASGGNVSTRGERAPRGRTRGGFSVTTWDQQGNRRGAGAPTSSSRRGGSASAPRGYYDNAYYGSYEDYYGHGYDYSQAGYGYYDGSYAGNYPPNTRGSASVGRGGSYATGYPSRRGGLSTRGGNARSATSGSLSASRRGTKARKPSSSARDGAHSNRESVTERNKSQSDSHDQHSAPFLTPGSDHKGDEEVWETASSELSDQDSKNENIPVPASHKSRSSRGGTQYYTSGDRSRSSGGGSRGANTGGAHSHAPGSGAQTGKKSFSGQRPAGDRGNNSNKSKSHRERAVSQDTGRENKVAAEQQKYKKHVPDISQYDMNRISGIVVIDHNTLKPNIASDDDCPDDSFQEVVSKRTRAQKAAAEKKKPKESASPGKEGRISKGGISKKASKSQTKSSKSQPSAVSIDVASGPLPPRLRNRSANGATDVLTNIQNFDSVQFGAGGEISGESVVQSDLTSSGKNSMPTTPPPARNASNAWEKPLQTLINHNNQLVPSLPMVKDLPQVSVPGGSQQSGQAQASANWNNTGPFVQPTRNESEAKRSSKEPRQFVSQQYRMQQQAIETAAQAVVEAGPKGTAVAFPNQEAHHSPAAAAAAALTPPVPTSAQISPQITTGTEAQEQAPDHGLDTLSITAAALTQNDPQIDFFAKQELGDFLRSFEQESSQLSTDQSEKQGLLPSSMANASQSQSMMPSFTNEKFRHIWSESPVEEATALETRPRVESVGDHQIMDGSNVDMDNRQVVSSQVPTSVQSTTSEQSAKVCTVKPQKQPQQQMPANAFRNTFPNNYSIAQSAPPGLAEMQNAQAAMQTQNFFDPEQLGQVPGYPGYNFYDSPSMNDVAAAAFAQHNPSYIGSQLPPGAGQKPSQLQQQTNTQAALAHANWSNSGGAGGALFYPDSTPGNPSTHAPGTQGAPPQFQPQHQFAPPTALTHGNNTLGYSSLLSLQRSQQAQAQANFMQPQHVAAQYGQLMGSSSLQHSLSNSTFPSPQQAAAASFGLDAAAFAQHPAGKAMSPQSLSNSMSAAGMDYKNDFLGQFGSSGHDPAGSYSGNSGYKSQDHYLNYPKQNVPFLSRSNSVNAPGTIGNGNQQMGHSAFQNQQSAFMGNKMFGADAFSSKAHEAGLMQAGGMGKNPFNMRSDFMGANMPPGTHFPGAPPPHFSQQKSNSGLPLNPNAMQNPQTALFAGFQSTPPSMRLQPNPIQRPSAHMYSRSGSDGSSNAGMRQNLGGNGGHLPSQMLQHAVSSSQSIPGGVSAAAFAASLQQKRNNGGRNSPSSMSSRPWSSDSGTGNGNQGPAQRMGGSQSNSYYNIQHGTGMQGFSQRGPSGPTPLTATQGQSKQRFNGSRFANPTNIAGQNRNGGNTFPSADVTGQNVIAETTPRGNTPDVPIDIGASLSNETTFESAQQSIDNAIITAPSPNELGESTIGQSTVSPPNVPAEVQQIASPSPVGDSTSSTPMGTSTPPVTASAQMQVQPVALTAE